MATIVTAAIVLGLLIFFHELGHFLVAKWSGVGVERFSIGFGPRLFTWRKRETEYCLSAVPLGGYVKMVGEDPAAEVEIGPAEREKSFVHKPLWTRFLIVFAGPASNFVLAAVIFSLIFMIVGWPVLAAVVGRVQEDSPARAAGIQSGDRIIAVNGIPVRHWDELASKVLKSNGQPLALSVQRGGQELSFQVRPVMTKGRTIFGEEADAWDLGIGPFVPAKVGEVLPGSPAARAEVKSGDVIVAFNGKPILSWDELAKSIHKHPNQKIALTVDRGGRRFDIEVVPELVKARNPLGEEVEEGRIGIGFAQPGEFVRSNPVRALGQGVIRTYEVSALTVVSFWKLIRGTIPRNQIGGPIQIVVSAGEQAKQGLLYLANFTAFISINLAILNLLPVPMLDGGHLFFFVIEVARGRPMSLRKREIAQQLGLFLLILLMVFAFYNDIMRFVAR